MAREKITTPFGQTANLVEPGFNRIGLQITPTSNGGSPQEFIVTRNGKQSEQVYNIRGTTPQGKCLDMSSQQLSPGELKVSRAIFKLKELITGIKFEEHPINHEASERDQRTTFGVIYSANNTGSSV